MQSNGSSSADDRRSLMAIFGIGAYYNEDVSTQFVLADIVGIGWNK